LYRYIAFLWSPSDRESDNTALHMMRSLTGRGSLWTAELRAPGTAVFAIASSDVTITAYALPFDTGIILGRLFPKEPNDWHPGRRVYIDNAVADRISRTAGASLAAEYWGSYVAFLRDHSNGAHHVLRDCSGKLQCFLTKHRRVSIAFSDVNDLSALTLPPFQINRTYIAAFIYEAQCQIPSCGLLNFTELLAGERHTLHGASAQASSVWDPRDVVRTSTVEGIAEARSRLKLTTEFCVNAWASAYTRILHSLSGGLDSAIVLGCLCNAPRRPQITCVNRFNDDVGEDERRYARLAAARSHLELLESPWCVSERPFDSTLLAAPRTVKPFIPLPLTIVDIESWNAIAKDTRAEAIWTGEGGDHLFFNIPTSLGAADYYQAHGIGPGFLRAIFDSSNYSKEPYVNVLKSALRLGRSRSPWTSDARARRNNRAAKIPFVNYDALPAEVDSYTRHPWMTDMDDLPKGKQLQIELLSELLNRHRPIPRIVYADEHDPLISQPLLEASLQIPLYVLTAEGRPRALARQVFRDVVPAEIIAREDKGSTTLLWMDRIRESQAFICELLLDGWLAREGIIKRLELEPFIAHGEALREEHWSPLVACIAAEVWARSWTGSMTSSASTGLPNTIAESP
jgi:asparagine synthase (glutamine-hydrolysing)